MRKISIITAIAMTLTVMTASAALADPDGPTCANQQAIDEGFDLGVDNHGGHVIRDYVKPAVGDPTPGGPAAGAHFLGDTKPGASFCIGNANSSVIYANPGKGRP